MLLNETLIIARSNALQITGSGHDRPLQRLPRCGCRPCLRRRAPTVEEYAAIAERCSAPCVANMSETGRSPAIPTDELETMGYKLVIFPSTQTWVFAKAYEELCQAVLRDRTTAALGDRFTSFDDVNALARPGRVAVAVSARDVYDERGFGGRQGAGERPAVVVVDFIDGCANPESALACDAAVQRSRRPGRCSTRPVLRPCPFSSRPSAYDEGDLERAAMFIAKAPALATLRPGSPWIEVDARLGRRRRGAGARRSSSRPLLRHEPRRAAARRGLRHGDRHGASTSGCVRATAVDALQYGYRVLVPRDAVADRAADAHTGSLLDIDAKYGDVISDRRGDRRRRRRRPGRAQAGHDRDRDDVRPRHDPRRVRRRRVGGDGRAPRAARHHARTRRVRRLRDPLGPRRALQAALGKAGVESDVFDRISGEPSEDSVADARDAARQGYDGFIGVGGGSALDTAKLCALFATHAGELLDYVNAPIGRGTGARARPSARRIAHDLRHGLRGHDGRGDRLSPPRHEDGGLAPHLRPTLAIVDPALTVSCPPGVTAATGIDALMHALEAYTVSAYDTRARLPLPQRPPYQGANPFSDPLCERAIALIGESLRTAVADGDDLEARTAMALASTVAGIAFSGAGVHVPHALAYPIASLQHDWRPPGYGGAALVPHGFAVAVTAPAVFRLVADAVPERCATAARLLDGGDDLADSVARLMEDVGAPTRLSELGYREDDIAKLIPGALDQRRLLVGSPKDIGAAELEALLRTSL